MSEQNENLQNTAPEAGATAPAENPNVKKRWFGRGIYGSKDVPIRALDACIGVMIAAAILLTIIGAVTGGFAVNFDSGLSDVKVDPQKVHHGAMAAEPEDPVRPGYTLVGWSTTQPPEITLWDFETRTVQNDMTLYAVWQQD